MDVTLIFILCNFKLSISSHIYMQVKRPRRFSLISFLCSSEGCREECEFSFESLNIVVILLASGVYMRLNFFANEISY